MGEISKALTKVLPRQCGGKYRGFALCRQKGPCGGKQLLFYQRAVLAGLGFSRDLLDQKSKALLFPGGEGGGGHGYLTGALLSP